MHLRVAIATILLAVQVYTPLLLSTAFNIVIILVLELKATLVRLLASVVNDTLACGLDSCIEQSSVIEPPTATVFVSLD